MRVLALGFSLLLTLGLVGPLSPIADGAHAGTVAAAAKAKKPRNVAKNYHPAPGVVFNDPYNRKPYQATTIRAKALNSINSTKRGSVIRMAMFNFRSPSYLNALIKAHQRGVQVQVLMYHGNDTPELGNPDPKALRKELRKGNAGLPASKQSFFKECRGSCRGSGGITHYKFFTFSSVGRKDPVRDVVEYGSNNATDVAVNQQWNDWYTYTGQAGIYNAFNAMFAQAALDKNVKSGAYATYNELKETPPTTLTFFPDTGKAAKKAGDPVMNALNEVSCTGTTIKGLHGHTRLRIAQDAIAGDRGITIAHKVAALKKAGCDIKIVYTLMGGQVKNIFTKVHIPMVHYAYDRNGDCEYDMYLHAKDLAIQGNFDGVANNFVTFNGTANWTPLPLISDEVIAEIHDRRTTKQYSSWIDWLMKNRPSWWPKDGSTTCTPPPDNAGRVGVDGTTTRKVDPYAIVKQND